MSVRYNGKSILHIKYSFHCSNAEATDRTKKVRNETKRCEKEQTYAKSKSEKRIVPKMQFIRHQRTHICAILLWYEMKWTKRIIAISAHLSELWLNAPDNAIWNAGQANKKHRYISPNARFTVTQWHFYFAKIIINENEFSLPL